MKIVTLLENTACGEEFRRAHGLSLYVETAKHRLLFDMGPDDGFAANAEALGVDLKAVDIAVLSHGHYDHGGGLRTFLSRNRQAKVYLRRGAFGDYYALDPGAEPRYIGIDPALREFEDRFVYTGAVMQLDGELTLFGDVPDDFAGMDASAKLKEKTADGFRPDAFRHEQDLLITAEGKAVLIAGCAHRGIVNIKNKAAALLGREPDVVVGGFHLFELAPGAPESDALIGRTGRALLEGNTVYYTGHCTGDYAYEKLGELLGSRLHRIRGGTTLEL
jgi:7,8-dihydropterin-6-yl-methyl-4-(beta-D-ribofuranosyl)aminobenzene 5'-phosphate synthase